MILIIDNYDSFTYNLYQLVAGFAQDTVIIRNDKITINEIAHLKPAGIVLSPGPGRPETAGICIALVQALISGLMRSTPLLGVCLGHQAIVVAAGGAVIRANEIVHGKEDMVYHKQGDLYKSLPQPFKVGRYHSLIAERPSLPASLLVEAENSQQIIMGVRHRTLPIYGVQFHPESILTPDGQCLLHTFIASCRQEVAC